MDDILEFAYAFLGVIAILCFVVFICCWANNLTEQDRLFGKHGKVVGKITSLSGEYKYGSETEYWFKYEDGKMFPVPKEIYYSTQCKILE